MSFSDVATSTETPKHFALDIYSTVLSTSNFVDTHPLGLLLVVVVRDGEVFYHSLERQRERALGHARATKVPEWGRLCFKAVPFGAPPRFEEFRGYNGRKFFGRPYHVVSHRPRPGKYCEISSIYLRRKNRHISKSISRYVRRARASPGACLLPANTCNSKRTSYILQYTHATQ